MHSVHVRLQPSDSVAYDTFLVFPGFLRSTLVSLSPSPALVLSFSYFL